MKIYNLYEISDSRILYDKRPPKFIVLLIFVISFILVSFIVWSYSSIRTYVVKGQGIVTTQQKAQNMSKVSGEVTDIYMEENKEVHIGDILLKVNPVDSNLQLNQTNSQLDVLKKRITLLAKAENEATKGINTFKKVNFRKLCD